MHSKMLTIRIVNHKNHPQDQLDPNVDMYAMQQLLNSNACGTNFGHQSYITDFFPLTNVFSSNWVPLRTSNRPTPKSPLLSLKLVIRPKSLTRHWSPLLNQQLGAPITNIYDA